MKKKGYQSKRKQKKSANRTRNIIVIGSVFILLAGYMIWTGSRPDSVSLERQMDQPVRGNPDAPVSIEVFSDFGCIACQNLAQSHILEDVLDYYAGQVNIIWRDYPIISPPQSIYAAQAGQCAHDQGMFWEFHDTTYARTDFNAFRADDLRGYALEIGLDMTAYDACVAAGTHVATVDYDKQAASKLGIRGTPALIINGNYLYSWDVNVLVAAIDSVLANQ